MVHVNGIQKAKPPVTPSIKFYGSQVGGEVSVPLPYTGSPIQLLTADLKFFFSQLYLVPYLILPWRPHPSGSLDEVYPSFKNYYNIALHAILFVCQASFLLSIPLWLFFPVWIVASLAASFISLNYVFCFLLNGLEHHYDSDPVHVKDKPSHPKEAWIFLNGIAVGKHWLISNVNLLSLIFARPIKGIHNRTSGIIFDLLECLIQRDLSYATPDIRDCYAVIKSTLYSDVTKVVFILHSQGGIEGGLILDWLLQEVPLDLLAKLEVYTFGNAANHFNNPHRHLKGLQIDMNNSLKNRGSNGTSGERNRGNDRAIRHIEHYANSMDIAARWGVLNTALDTSNSAVAPRFMGRVFEREGTGHLFNQHYLDAMFSMNADMTHVLDNNDFMDSVIEAGRVGNPGIRSENKSVKRGLDDIREDLEQSWCSADPEARDREGVVVREQDGSQTPIVMDFQESGEDKGEGVLLRVRHLSRLWLYRNGGSPPDEMMVDQRGLPRMATI